MKMMNNSSALLLGNIFILVITVTDQVCPNGFVMHTTYTNKCYKISESAQKWNESVTYCGSLGASVAYVYNEVIHNFVGGLFTSQTRIWIGLKSASGQYLWLDDGAVDWSVWSASLPTYTRCVVYKSGTSGWEWYEHPCNSPSHVLCEYTINEGTQTNVTLVGGTNTTGRAEVYNNNRWGTICHSNPDNHLGHVICDTLGLEFQSYLSTLPGTGTTWLQDINCSQVDSDLNQCVITSGGVWGSNSNCHSNDIHVNCSEKNIQSSYTSYLEPSSDTYITLPASDVTSGSTDILAYSTEPTNNLLLYASTSCTESLSSSSVLMTSSFCTLSTITVVENLTVTESITTTVTVYATPSYSEISQGSDIPSKSAIVSTQLNTNTQSSVGNGYSALTTGHFNRRTSAMYSVATKYDMRPSAIAVGTIGIIGLLFPIVLIIVADALTISKNLKQINKQSKQYAKKNHKKYKQTHNELSRSVTTMGTMETSTPPFSHIMPRHKDIIHVKSPTPGLGDSFSGKQTRFTRL